MSVLAKQIEQFNNELATQVPQEVLEAFGKSIEDLKTKPIEDFQSVLTEEVGFPPNLISQIKLPDYSPAQLPQEADLLLVEKWLKERNLVKPDFDISSIIVTDFIP